MKRIKTKSGETVKVDDLDFDFLNQFTWYLEKGNTRGTEYARAYTNKKWVKMHRLIMGVTDPKLLVDHMDHNGLNNQRDNLRVCTNSQNQMNRRSAFGKSGYIGVTKRRDGLFSAAVYVKKKYCHLGYYKDEIIAAKVRDFAAILVYREFGTYNDVEPLRDNDLIEHVFKRLDETVGKK